MKKINIKGEKERYSYLDNFMIPMMTSNDEGRGRRHLAHSVRVSPSIWYIKMGHTVTDLLNNTDSYVFDKHFNENDQGEIALCLV